MSDTPPLPPEPDSDQPEVDAPVPPKAHVEFPCEKCGAKMDFSPTDQQVTCPYCNHAMTIPQSDEQIDELDFHAYLAEAEQGSDMEEAVTVSCSACGASTTLAEDTTADNCPFCGSPIVAEGVSSRTIRPRSLLPFQISRAEAMEKFQGWVKGLWFAPNRVKQYARTDKSSLNGMYVPHWTYDANTITHYTGQRGDDYYVTETYTTTENGKSVQKTRQVRKTRWHRVSGTVFRSFDDVLVLGSHSLPETYARKLEPWDLEHLVPYDDSYLAGFRAERYQVGLEDGFDEAAGIMDKQIRKDIERDIGGDHQRISSVTTQHNNLTFKHILLPVWISAYTFRDKTYRFLVNARTGEVQGERPYSWIKITLAAVAAAAAIGAIVYALSLK